MVNAQHIFVINDNIVVSELRPLLLRYQQGGGGVSLGLKKGGMGWGRASRDQGGQSILLSHYVQHYNLPARLGPCSQL